MTASSACAGASLHFPSPPARMRGVGGREEGRQRAGRGDRQPAASQQRSGAAASWKRSPAGRQPAAISGGWRSPPGGTASASPQVRQHLAAPPAPRGCGWRRGQAGSRCLSRSRWRNGRPGAAGQPGGTGTAAGRAAGNPQGLPGPSGGGTSGEPRAVSRQASSPAAAAGRCGGGLARGERVRARRRPGTPREVNAWLGQVEKSEEQGDVYAILRGLCFGGVAVRAGNIFVSSF